MADNNHNWNNQSGKGWDQNRNRFNQEDENRNRENYGGGYNQNQYDNTGYGAYGGDYGSQYGSGGYSGSDFEPGRQSGGYGRQNIGGSYGNQYGRENDWNRDQGRGNVNTGNYGSGYDERSYGDDYGSSSGYGSYGGHDRSRYGGGHRNDGNSNLRNRVNKWLDRAKEEVSYWFNNEDDSRKSGSGYGGHRGKGPNDYRRSEDRIKEDICDRLTDDDRVDASNIRVQLENDVAILSGTVNSREEKRRAVDLVETVSGVRDVENRIRVSRSESGLNDSTGTTDKSWI
jgi:osmotically-inducible protein OsmY